MYPWESVSEIQSIKGSGFRVYIKRYRFTYFANTGETLSPIFGCKPVGLQPIGVLPELHYVMFVRRLQICPCTQQHELGAKPAQLCWLQQRRIPVVLVAC